MESNTIPNALFSSVRVTALGRAALILSPLALFAASAGAAPPSQIRLEGVVRDFRGDHPDFNITDPAVMGQYSGLLGQTLGVAGRPIFTGDGRNIVAQFTDMNANEIAPYGDRGLIGGHFDVDVFDAPTDSKRFHEHQFDDQFDTATIDIDGDPILLFDDICAGYPNPLRIEVLNPHNSGLGQYVFEAGGVFRSGRIDNGIPVTFLADDLTQFAITFQTLNAMRGTKPKTSQRDIIDRDDSFAIRMFDTVTDALVYEIVAYEHVGKNDGDPWVFVTPPDRAGSDSCGDPFADTSGTYGAPGTAGIANGDSFNQWYRHTPGINLEAPHGIILDRNPDGVYEYTTNSFFPIDGDLYGNEGAPHNTNFTFEINVNVRYAACQDQFIQIQSTDDAWVFINGKLVVDIGGVATSAGQRIDLDRLNLVDGEEISVDIFYANRGASPESFFSLSTNMEFAYRGVLVPTMVGFD